jgi:hypothetical protein
MSLLTNDKITEIFCATDEFCKEFSKIIKEERRPAIGDGKKQRSRQSEMYDSEIITILILYHFGSFANFKHFYLHHIKVHLKKDFPKVFSYNRFVAIEHKVFVPMMLFLNLIRFGKCTGITFVDSTKIAVCHNKRIFNRKVFNNLAKCGKSTMGWFCGFKLHFVCNDKGEILDFFFSPGNTDDRSLEVFNVLKKTVREVVW